MKRAIALSLLVVLVISLLPGGNAMPPYRVWARESAPNGSFSPQAPLGTAFTYQGYLENTNGVVSDTCDFQFSLWDASTNGAQVGSTQTKTGVQVDDGYFTVADLDFGAGVFTGEARYLQIAVKCSGDSDYVSLSGRVALNAAPYAQYALGAPWSGLSGVPAGFADGTDDDTTYTAGTGLSLGSGAFSITTSYRLPQSCANGEIAEWNGMAWVCGTDDVGSGGGGGDITAVYAGYGLGGGGESGAVTLYVMSTTMQTRVGSACPAGQSIRQINQDGTVVCETDDDTTYTAGTGLSLGGGAFSITTSYRLPQSCANGEIAEWNGSAWACGTDDTGGTGNAWSLTGNSGTNPSTNFLGTTDRVSLTLAVSGTAVLRLEPGPTNNVGPNVIGGHASNRVVGSATGATIAGGGDVWSPNVISGTDGTVGGGLGNAAAGGAVVSGGSQNTAAGESSVVGGGYQNAAREMFSAVSGGGLNTASGFAATVGGGGGINLSHAYGNTASGAWSTVGGGASNYAVGVTTTIGGGAYVSVTGQAATVAGGYNITVTGNYAVVGGGYENAASGGYTFLGGGTGNTAGGDTAAVGGGMLNSAGGSYAFVGGGWNNTANGADSTVSGGYGNQVEAHSTAGTVAGGYGNLITNTALFAAIGGGYSNLVTATYGTIAGGYDVTVTAPYATVGGGGFNTASGHGAVVAGGGGEDPIVARNLPNTASGDLSTIGGGGLNTASEGYATVSGGGENTAAGWAATIGGGESHVISSNWGTIAGGYNITVTGGYAVVGGGYENAASGGYTFLGGGAGNTVGGDTAAVGGGMLNAAGGDYAFVGGGWNNAANGADSTVSGGYGNRVETNSTAGTVAGGYGNLITNTALFAAIGGGYSNLVTADYGTIAGGDNITVTGQYATVPGGYSNAASGDYSFAAGHQATALHNGAFVWSDAGGSVTSQRSNQFLVQANGGARFQDRTGMWVEMVYDVDRPIDTSTGAYLTGGGVWTDSSDRNLKENFEPVNPAEVLEEVAQLPITTWNYKAEDESVRHLGPVAQDFYAAFGLGADDKHIAALDSSGVALAAIQGLYEQNQALRQENAELRARLDDVEARLAALESRSSAPVQSNLLLWPGLVLGGLGLFWVARRRDD